MDNIRTLSDQEHILARGNMYIGALSLTNSYEYIFDNDKIEYKEVSFVPGFIKIINEIIDNSVDIAIKTNFKHSNIISVKIDAETVEVQDNGTGIPIIKNDEKEYIPKLCWGKARTGSNFDDDENRTQIGFNGVGSFATNCFSKKFIGNSDDGKKSYAITFTDNASAFTEKLGKSKKSGVTVKFWPDLEKFGLEEIDDIHINIIKQRLINLSMSFPEITFKFNGKKINVNSFKKYVSMFNETFEIHETEDYKFAILPNEDEEFRQFSYVNGLKIPDGGTHIDIISWHVVSRLREKLSKKFKSIKPADIKNKLMIIALLKNVKNTKFNSQAKEKITNGTAEINEYYGEIPFDEIAKKILRNKAMIDPITEIYRIKEEFKKRQELKGLKKTVKKIKSEKYLPPTGIKKYLVLVEGECLEENTEILMSDYSTKKIKDVNIGDNVISGDLTVQTVQAQTKLLKETLTIETPSGKVTCGKNHKLKVYDTKNNTFDFVKASIIKDDINRYKIVKCKINADSTGLKVINNDLNKKMLELDNGCISYTDDDNFVIIKNNNIIKLHSSEISKNDIIIMS